MSKVGLQLGKAVGRNTEVVLEVAVITATMRMVAQPLRRLLQANHIQSGASSNRQATTAKPVRGILQANHREANHIPSLERKEGAGTEIRVRCRWATWKVR